MDPWPWTLRELINAANKKQLHDYDLTSRVQATIASYMSGRPHAPHEFNHFRDDQGNPRV